MDTLVSRTVSNVTFVLLVITWLIKATWYMQSNFHYTSSLSSTSATIYFSHLPHARASGIWENFACGIWNPGFGIRNTAQGIRNPTNDWNLESKFHWQRLKSSTWSPKSTEWKKRRVILSFGDLVIFFKFSTPNNMMTSWLERWNRAKTSSISIFQVSVKIQ